MNTDNGTTKFILATENLKKVKEIKAILEGFPLEVITMEQAGFSGSIVEDQDTFEGNALKKAQTVHKQTGGFVMADDSGLAIDPLDGKPGIFSARWVHPTASYPEKIQDLWDRLGTFPPDTWTARFICAIAVVRPDGSFFVVEGNVEGLFHPKMIGDNGFGYDPVFYLPAFQKTMAQLTAEEKNKISHRGQALERMLAKLNRS